MGKYNYYNISFNNATTQYISLPRWRLLSMKSTFHFIDSRLLHHRLIYKHIHKKHHEWTAPIAAAAVYSHPIEHILSGQIPVGMGIMLLSPPIPVVWLW